MILHLNRYKFTDTFTMGELRVDYQDGRGSQWFGWVVEDADRGLHMCDSDEAVKSVKVPKETAIGVGFFPLVLESSGKFGPETITLKPVTGFQYIRLHVGRDAKRTWGCITPGMGKDDDRGIITRSEAAVDWLEDTLRPILRRGEPVSILIDREPRAWAARLAQMEAP